MFFLYEGYYELCEESLLYKSDLSYRELLIQFFGSKEYLYTFKKCEKWQAHTYLSTKPFSKCKSLLIKEIDWNNYYIPQEEKRNFKQFIQKTCEPVTFKYI